MPRGRGSQGGREWTQGGAEGGEGVNTRRSGEGGSRHKGERESWKGVLRREGVREGVDTRGTREA